MGRVSFGGGRGVRSLIAVFVGTRVGSGAVMDGLLLRGFNNAAGEVGHTQVVVDGLPCPCGQRGCVEAYVSGSGFIRRLQTGARREDPHRLADETGGDASRLTAVLVARAAAAGDPMPTSLMGVTPCDIWAPRSPTTSPCSTPSSSSWAAA